MTSPLVAAREVAGYSQDDVAAALGITRVMVSYWESGSRPLSPQYIAALARLFRVSPAELMSTEPLQPRADEAKMLFRRAASELSAVARQGIGEFLDFLDSYSRLADAAKFDVHGLSESPFVSSSNFRTDDDARRKAEEVRSYLRLGLGSIADMDTVADLLGITVFRAALGPDLAETISGAFYQHPEIGFSVLVNLEMTPGRRRFTLAHEIAHALFHSRTERIVLSRPGAGPNEHFADVFAGEFLMPTEGVRRFMEEHNFGPRVTDPADAVHLQRYFNVSFPTTLVRLRNANLIDREHFEEFKAIRPVLLAQALGFEVSDEELRQDPELWRLSRFPRRFISLVRLSVREGVVSPSTVAGMTGLALDDIEDLVGLAPIAGEFDDHDSGLRDQEMREFESSGVLTR
jgi:Zn-dependent peptidase ImmA (M78 family)/DNA-binding transcriptional regulator YdaS (Cro superfamily)